MKRVLLIDADYWLYVINSQYHETPTRIALVEDFKRISRQLCNGAKTSHYAFLLGDPINNFRKGIYKVAAYKGNRTPLDANAQANHDLMRDVLETEFNAYWVKSLEADDLISYLGHQKSEETTYVISSPDKDLNQVPGERLLKGSSRVVIDETEAENWLCMQMLTGDTVDNIHGIPGIGPVKAAKILAAAGSKHFAVKEQYHKHYGVYYGEIIYQETYSTVRLMSQFHPCFFRFEASLKLFRDVIFKPTELNFYELFNGL